MPKSNRIPAPAVAQSARYILTIRHHSISRAREIVVHGTLAAAKAQAEAEFGDEQRDYVIVIYEDSAEYGPHLVASRRVGAGTWEDLP